MPLNLSDQILDDLLVNSRSVPFNFAPQYFVSTIYPYSLLGHADARQFSMALMVVKLSWNRAVPPYMQRFRGPRPTPVLNRFSQQLTWLGLCLATLVIYTFNEFLLHEKKNFINQQWYMPRNYHSLAASELQMDWWFSFNFQTPFSQNFISYPSRCLRANHNLIGMITWRNTFYKWLNY